MKEHKNFWDRNAGRYDRFMRKDWAAYEEMYELIRLVVKAKTVLEPRQNGTTDRRSCTFRCRICSACPMRMSPLMW